MRNWIFCQTSLFLEADKMLLGDCSIFISCQKHMFCSYSGNVREEFFDNALGKLFWICEWRDFYLSWNTFLLRRDSLFERVLKAPRKVLLNLSKEWITLKARIWFSSCAGCIEKKALGSVRLHKSGGTTFYAVLRHGRLINQVASFDM